MNTSTRSCTSPSGPSCFCSPTWQAVIFEANDPTGAFRLDATQITNVGSQTLINATVVCAMLPICVLYPFLQKFFVSGVVLGAVKG